MPELSRAELAVERALRRRDRSLDLSGLSLENVPDSVRDLTYLEELDLRNNKLESLPEWLCELAGLDMLSLDANHFTRLPTWIGRMRPLKWLSLADNRLTALPEAVGDLVMLADLRVGLNQLSSLPPTIGRLTRLVRLSLGDNPLLMVPAWIGMLTELSVLDLSRTRISDLPDSFGQLNHLTALYMDDNLLATVPEPIRQLTRLSRLSLSGNMISELPNWIGELGALAELSLDNNRLRRLPESVGGLAKLTRLDLHGNKIVFPPSAVAALGAEAVQAFIRDAKPSARRQWRSKILFVGEGGAGKTTLLKVLSGGTADPQEKTTHGLNIESLQFPHPTEDGVMMRLSAWDFGGQHVYHSTHQFFLTDQSLFLLVWNARSGWEQAKGRYWLDTIKARTGGHVRGGAPVILVATHSQHRSPDLPLSELQRDYPNIVASIQVESLAEVENGIDQLQLLIRSEAAKLPLMGSAWPSSWIAAQQAIRDCGRNHTGKEHFYELLTSAGVADSRGQQAFTKALHQLGDILHYSADPELSDTVVVNPAWLSERIAAILDCRPVAERYGVLLSEDISREWSDVGKELQAQLLFMMDRYDVSYRIHDSSNGAKAIVVDRLPWEPPDYQTDWQAALDRPGARELRLNYAISGTVPPGIPGWFIARAHRFADLRHRPWRTGVLLAHPDGQHLGLLRLDEQNRTVELSVRGPRPAAFLGMLDLDFNQATMQRYPGLSVARTVPCPCQPGCPTNWPFDKLTALQLKGQNSVQCVESGKSVHIGLLIDGITPAGSGEDLAGLTATLYRLEAGVHQTNLLVREQGILLREDADLRHLQFASLMSWIQATVPTVFTITRKRRHLPGTQRYTLRLYCSEPNAFHQLPNDGGCYQLTALENWAGALVRRMTTVIGLLSAVSGLSSPVLGKTAPELLARNKEDIKRLQETLSHLKEIMKKTGERDVVSDLPNERGLISEEDIRQLEELLKSVDPHRRWGGLVKTVTPGGLTLFLCKDHARAYTATSPRPHGL